MAHLGNLTLLSMFFERKSIFLTASDGILDHLTQFLSTEFINYYIRGLVNFVMNTYARFHTIRPNII